MNTETIMDMLIRRHSHFLATRGVRAACLETADTLRHRHSAARGSDRGYFAGLYVAVLECLRAVDPAAADRQPNL